MADFDLILGGIVFQKFEIPPKINFGGVQRIAKHNLIGVNRVIDAMGPVEDDIEWAGRFRALGAVARATALDQMRADGAQVPLIWGGMYRMVVVEHFEADFMKLYEIPYRINCAVAANPTLQAFGLLSAALDDVIGADIGALSGLTNFLA